MPRRHVVRARRSALALATMLAALATVAACVSVSVGRGRTPARQTLQDTLPSGRLPRTGDDPVTPRGTEATQAALARRRVTAKEAPAALLSDDRLRCTVSADRYERTKVGDEVTCVWTMDTESGTRSRDP